ncbi:hypothetical protein D3C87_1259530 [compost metagenome]
MEYKFINGSLYESEEIQSDDTTGFQYFINNVNNITVSSSNDIMKEIYTILDNKTNMKMGHLWVVHYKRDVPWESGFPYVWDGNITDLESYIDIDTTIDLTITARDGS